MYSNSLSRIQLYQNVSKCIEAHSTNITKKLSNFSNFSNVFKCNQMYQSVKMQERIVKLFAVFLQRKQDTFFSRKSVDTYSCTSDWITLSFLVQQYLCISVPQQKTSLLSSEFGQQKPVFHFPKASMYPEQYSEPRTAETRKMSWHTTSKY